MSNVQTSRTRVITWEDPAAAVQTGKTISGIEYLKALQSGELPPPPIAVLMGMWITEVSEGRVVFAAEPAEYHYNPLGTVHGGVMATLLDSALGCVVQSMLPAGISYTTVELKVNYLRPITVKTGTVYCEGKIIYVGGRIATAEGRLTDGEGKLYAHGTTTCLILRPSSPSAQG
ncbi:MAG TPA: PaaI family thioesterase [Ktedonobacteraceae bacterium]|nr:PaaI family thioesterase [Ktedonobacteraceae bacterium]